MRKAGEKVFESFLTNGKLDLELLGRLQDRPEPFSTGEELFWDDEHISMHMLEAHLNPEWDAASYQTDKIDRICKWLVEHLQAAPGMKLIDLGCGPGLYCERFHQHGLQVTGVDYSRRSLAYARSQAAIKGWGIEYIYRDYLTLDYREEYDRAVLIYYDFGVFGPDERRRLLGNIHRLLKKDGYFVLDLLTPQAKDVTVECQKWSVCRGGGFWKPGDYLELYNRSYYPEESVFLDRYLILEADGKVSDYRIWQCLYTRESITTLLEECGFQVEGVYEDLTGAEYRNDSGTIGILARKKSE